MIEGITGPMSNGPELVSRAIVKWIADEGTATALPDPGKPWQNDVNESCNGKFRHECLNMEWFRSSAEAKVVIDSWLKHFNTVLPHLSLGYLNPGAFAEKCRDKASASEPATSQDAAVLGACGPQPMHNRSGRGRTTSMGGPGFSS
jgi:hypothetical protein